jgi:hypothetical protein
MKKIRLVPDGDRKKQVRKGTLERENDDPLPVRSINLVAE